MNLKEIYKNMTDEEIKQRYNKKENYNIDEQKLIKREAEERLMIDDRINRIVRHRNMLRDFINISMKICFKMFYLFFIILMLSFEFSVCFQITRLIKYSINEKIIYIQMESKEKGSFAKMKHEKQLKQEEMEWKKKVENNISFSLYTPQDILFKYHKLIDMKNNLILDIKETIVKVYEKKWTEGGKKYIKKTYQDNKNRIVYEINELDEIEQTKPYSRGSYVYYRESPIEKGYFYDENTGLLSFAIVIEGHNSYVDDLSTYGKKSFLENYYTSNPIKFIFYNYNNDRSLKKETIHEIIGGVKYSKIIKEYVKNKIIKEHEFNDVETMLSNGRYNLIYVDKDTTYSDKMKVVSTKIYRKNKFNNIYSVTNIDYNKMKSITKYYNKGILKSIIEEDFKNKNIIKIKRKNLKSNFEIFDELVKEKQIYICNRFINYNKTNSSRTFFYNLTHNNYTRAELYESVIGVSENEYSVAIFSQLEDKINIMYYVPFNNWLKVIENKKTKPIRYEFAGKYENADDLKERDYFLSILNRLESEKIEEVSTKQIKVYKSEKEFLK